MPEKIHQDLALHEELLTSLRLIHAGLGQLQSLDNANDFFHLPLLTLATGFERLMKVILCLRTVEVKGRYPTGSEIPRGSRGHDLEFLLENIIEECFLSEYLKKRPVAREDLAFLQSNGFLRFIRALSRFGQSARYYNLNLILGDTGIGDSPEREWENLELEVLREREELMKEFQDNPSSKRVIKEIEKDIIIHLERFARALVRLFTLGEIGEEAKRYTGDLGSFLYLDDSTLGTRQYSPLGLTV